MKRIAAKALVLAGMSAALVGVNAQSASAAGCQFAADAYSTSTYAYGVSSYPCPQVQARIDRYYAGYVRTYTGPIASTSSVTASVGTNSGNYGRGGDGTLSNWIRFY